MVRIHGDDVRAACRACAREDGMAVARRLLGEIAGAVGCGNIRRAVARSGVHHEDLGAQGQFVERGPQERQQHFQVGALVLAGNHNREVKGRMWRVGQHGDTVP